MAGARRAAVAGARVLALLALLVVPAAAFRDLLDAHLAVELARQLDAPAAACKAGFAAADGGACTNVDECALGIDSCTEVRYPAGLRSRPGTRPRAGRRRPRMLAGVVVVLGPCALPDD